MCFKHLITVNVQQLDITLACNCRDQWIDFLCILDKCADGTGIVRVLDSHWNVALHGGLHSNGVQHLRPKVSQFAGLFVRNFRHRLCSFNDAWIRRQDTINIFPDLNFINTNRSTQECCCQIRSTASQGCDFPLGIMSNEPRHNAHDFGIQTVEFVSGLFNGIGQNFGIAKFGIRQNTNFPGIKRVGRYANLIQSSCHDSNRASFSVGN
mmetsp:Transcript_8115/g.20262  ORF Transcript_8115/g.20262 Transcript_8115/m.20262 type:complete len:209 (-) Transcript_8115:739-1365(-)